VSITTIKVYPFPDQITSQGSVPRTRIGPDFSNSVNQMSISTIEIYSFKDRTANHSSIPSQMSVYVSDSDDQGSITNIKIYAFLYTITNQDSSPDNQISTYFQYPSESQGSIPSQHDFSSRQNTCGVREIPRDTLGSFSNKQASLLS
jgi:hypothetical protein